MTITHAHEDGYFILRNKGRELGRWNNWAQFNAAANHLAHLPAQVDRPEAFCDCKPTQEVSRG